ncbi:carbamoyl-phosphate synthase large subunit [Keratinibaculum paraultunense]|uniref:Carbamoyl-phosphate synthase large subunit n=1 Tax=Keratinibaculum paraultunense TaxID=1278232 RepID=A0A4R3KTC7_9FIRM|nr:ATP-grasp domain-containing protein [Keratinibaculum paraultunense]QQY79131.1 ATP-grasp domain-containing protein [Keratinibaculum paraultunense]TCS88516.1 carbamoyl-phosphate synthase large subunit [Keratinibaculum paraultunense]
MFTAIGRRVQLINHFKKYHKVIGVDTGELAPAKHFVDSFYKVPKWDDKEYVNTLLNICKKENVDMLIPLYEKEFILLCENREKFNKTGTILILSDKKIIEIFNDKWESYRFFIENGIDTPMTYKKQGVKDFNFPLIIKPINGAGSQNVFKVDNKKELSFFIDYIENPIIQEYIKGTEYTIDVLCDLKGNVISIVPRERIEVRAGEVSKGRTVKNKDIIEKTLKLCNKLKIDKNTKPIGPLTIQCIVDLDNNIKFIEVNTRFGGGVPLTFEAGVPYAKYLGKMVEGYNVRPIIGEFKEMIMLRYDEAIYI